MTGRRRMGWFVLGLLLLAASAGILIGRTALADAVTEDWLYRGLVIFAYCAPIFSATALERAFRKRDPEDEKSA